MAEPELNENNKDEEKKEFSALRLLIILFLIFLLLTGLFALTWVFSHQEGNRGADDFDNVKITVNSALKTLFSENKEWVSEYMLDTDDIPGDRICFDVTLSSEDKSEVYLGGDSYGIASRIEFFDEDSNLIFVWLPQGTDDDLANLNCDKDIVTLGNDAHISLADSEYSAGDTECPPMVNDAIPILSFDKAGSAVITVVITPTDGIDINDTMYQISFVGISKADCPYTLVGENMIGNAKENEKIVYYNTENTYLCYYDPETYNKPNAPAVTDVIYSMNGKDWNNYGVYNLYLSGDVYVRIAETADYKKSNILTINTDK